MVTSLNSSVPARDFNYNATNTIRKRITFANQTATVVGKIPAGSSVIGGGVHVVTAFDAAATLNVGYIGATTVANAYASALTLVAVGYIPLDDLGATTNIQGTVEHTITCIVTTAATEGAADLIIQFVPPNPPV